MTVEPEQPKNTSAPGPYFGWGHHAALYPAIGRVAVYSALFDDLLREILCEIVGDNVWYMFEGQSTDWLVKACKDSCVMHNSGDMRWTEAEQARLLSALTPSQRLRDLRNYVIHGVWSTFATGDDDPPANSRPWGGEDGPDVLVSARSRQRSTHAEQLLSVEDVHRLADEFQKMTKAVAEAFYDMERRHTGGRLLPRWVDREENTKDFHPVRRPQLSP